MSKKMMKRSLALGALMAFVITGSAMAATVKTFNSSDEWYETNIIADGITAGTEGVWVNGSSVKDVVVNIGNDLTQTIEFSGKGYQAAGLYVNAPHDNLLKVTEVTFKASDHVKFTANGNYAGALWVAGHNSPNTKVTIEAPNVYISSDSMGIFNSGQATINIDGNTEGIISINAPYAISTRWLSETNINASGKHTVVINGDIEFGQNAKTDDPNAIVALNLANSSSIFNGNIIIGYGSSVADDERETRKAVNGMKLGLSNGATWHVTGNSFVNEFCGTNGNIVFAENVKHLYVDNCYASFSYTECDKTALGVKGELKINTAFNPKNSSQEPGTASLNLTMADKTADDLNTAEQLTTVAEKFSIAKESKDTIVAKVVMAEGDVKGETTGDVVFEVEDLEDKSYYHGEVKEVTEKVNTKNQAISDSGVALKLHWRSHMNDMNKRMGELRNADGEHGVWTRMVRGESEYKNTKAQYNQYQLGYDEKLSVDKRWTVGAAVTFADGDANYGQGTTEDKSTAFAIYGSKLNNDGTFVDLIARYAHLESDMEDVNSGKGDYSTNGMSVSAEFGKRIQQGNGLWIEPQVELTYGNFDSAEFVLGGKTVQVGDMDSLIGRVGFSLGKDIKQGNVYARASYLYDFDGETETAFSNATDTRTIKEDLGGGWWEVGVGANINLSKATYIYADVEKTFGGEVDTNWQWNLGVRYSF